jgi:hypothetical protein
MQKPWLLVAFLFFLTISACTPLDKQPPPPPPPPPNTAPVLSQPDNIAIIHNTLATPEEKTVSFTATDAEDTETLLTISAIASDVNIATLGNLNCNERGQCTLAISIKRVLPANVTITISVKDTKGSEAKTSFDVTVAPEEKNVADGAELKALLESSPPGSSIRLTSTHPISLDTQIMLDKELTLWGLGQDKTVLDAQTLDRHFWIEPTGKVMMHDLTLTNGNAKDGGSTIEGDRAGGAIFNEGTLRLENIRIINSRALDGMGTSKGKGGGIYNFTTGEATLIESVIGQEDNSNLATNSGGGLFNDGGKLEIIGSQVSFNEGVLRGGGIFNFREGELLVESSTFFNNFSEDGTAIKNEEAFALIRGSTLEKNVGTRLEGGAIVNLRGELELYDSVLKNNETLLGTGGAIYNGTTSTMLLDNTLLEGNKAASAGGAIYNEAGSGLLELRGGTKILNNSASRDGGGIYNAGNLKISSDCQISSNTANTTMMSFRGGGIFNAGTFTDTSGAILNQVVTNNQPDDVFTPPPPLMAFYRTLYKSR